jgi:hypothetical protein
MARRLFGVTEFKSKQDHPYYFAVVMDGPVTHAFVQAVAADLFFDKSHISLDISFPDLQEIQSFL